MAIKNLYLTNKSSLFFVFFNFLFLFTHASMQKEHQAFFHHLPYLETIATDNQIHGLYKSIQFLLDIVKKKIQNTLAINQKTYGKPHYAAFHKEDGIKNYFLQQVQFDSLTDHVRINALSLKLHYMQFCKQKECLDQLQKNKISFSDTILKTSIAQAMEDFIFAAKEFLEEILDIGYNNKKKITFLMDLPLTNFAVSVIDDYCSLTTTIKTALRKELEGKYNITIQFHPENSKQISINFNFNNNEFDIYTSPLSSQCSIEQFLTEKDDPRDKLDSISTTASTPPTNKRGKKSIFQRLFSCTNSIKKKKNNQKEKQNKHFVKTLSRPKTKLP